MSHVGACWAPGSASSISGGRRWVTPCSSTRMRQRSGGARAAAQAMERARLYRAEQRARADAEAANAAKSRFLAAMSHEIQFDQRHSRGTRSSWNWGSPGQCPTISARISRVSATATILLGLVDDVLDIAKTDAGEMRVAHELSDAGRAIDTAFDVTRPLAAARGVRLVDERPGATQVRFIGDEHRMRQILINLLTNAIKFTNAGGIVTVRLRNGGKPDPAARVRGRGPWTFVRVEDYGNRHRARRSGRRVRRVSPGRAGPDPYAQRDGTRADDQPPSRAAAGRALRSRVSQARGQRSPCGCLPPTTLGARIPQTTHVAAVLSMPKLTDLGCLLLEENGRLLETFVVACAPTRSSPGAKRLRTATSLEDHAVTMLSDIAQPGDVGEAGRTRRPCYGMEMPSSASSPRRTGRGATPWDGESMRCGASSTSWRK